MSDYSYLVLHLHDKDIMGGGKCFIVFLPKGVVVVAEVYINSGSAVPPELFTLVIACHFKD